MSRWVGEAQFVLARALVETKQTRERALSLAAQARESFQQSVAKRKRMADVDRWIEARHPRLNMR